MPFRIDDRRGQAAVLRGASPDNLPSVQALKQRDAERTRKAEVYRDGYAVPGWVLAAEAKDGIKRVFLRRGDWSGWTVPVFKPQEIKDLEVRTRTQYALDFVTKKWRPFTELYSPMSHDMKVQADAWYPDPGDPRRPVFDPESGDRGAWNWPAGAPKSVGEDVPREDLVSEHGFPLTGPATPTMGSAEDEQQEGEPSGISVMAAAAKGA